MVTIYCIEGIRALGAQEKRQESDLKLLFLKPRVCNMIDTMESTARLPFKVGEEVAGRSVRMTGNIVEGTAGAVSGGASGLGSRLSRQVFDLDDITMKDKGNNLSSRFLLLLFTHNSLLFCCQTLSAFKGSFWRR